jgi:hypothetical protein
MTMMSLMLRSLTTNLDIGKVSVVEAFPTIQPEALTPGNLWYKAWQRTITTFSA